MSTETLRAVHDAIAAHLASTNTEGILVDWCIGYQVVKGDDGFTIGYATPETSTPAGSIGLATLTAASLQQDLVVGRG